LERGYRLDFAPGFSRYLGKVCTGYPFTCIGMPFNIVDADTFAGSFLVIPAERFLFRYIDQILLLITQIAGGHFFSIASRAHWPVISREISIHYIVSAATTIHNLILLGLVLSR
jgi:hypothetical protein